MAGIFGNNVELACVAELEAPYVSGAAHMIVKLQIFTKHISLHSSSGYGTHSFHGKAQLALKYPFMPTFQRVS